MSKVINDRAARDRLYKKVAEVYIQENPNCCKCGGPATVVHHICKGTAGRGASLCNSDTWLPLCEEHHRWIHSAAGCGIVGEVLLKVRYVLRTISRLRGRAESAMTLDDLAAEERKRETCKKH